MLSVVNSNGHVYELVKSVWLPLIGYAILHVVFETLVILIAWSQVFPFYEERNLLEFGSIQVSTSLLI